MRSVVVFFNDTATTEIYTLSLHDALPISVGGFPAARRARARGRDCTRRSLPAAPARDARGRSPAATDRASARDRKSTRLNSSHANISYAVFCLKKNNTSAHHSSAPYLLLS